MKLHAVLEALGQTDIHLIDQFMKGRFEHARSVLDAGAGRGRNLRLFAGMRRVAVDPDAERLGDLPSDVERHVGRVQDFDWAPEFDAVICSAVLHFAASEAEFEAMVRACWSALAPGGVLFVRTAAVGGDFTVGDGVAPWCLAEADFAAWTERLGAEWVEPLRTSVVAGGRSMATWVLRKPGGAIFAP